MYPYSTSIRALEALKKLSEKNETNIYLFRYIEQA